MGGTKKPQSLDACATLGSAVDKDDNATEPREDGHRPTSQELLPLRNVAATSTAATYPGRTTLTHSPPSSSPSKASTDPLTGSRRPSLKPLSTPATRVTFVETDEDFLVAPTPCKAKANRRRGYPASGAEASGDGGGAPAAIPQPPGDSAPPFFPAGVPPFPAGAPNRGSRDNNATVPPPPLLAGPEDALPSLMSASTTAAVVNMANSTSLSPGVSFAGGNSICGSNSVRRPLTLLERRSARERSAMSISCLSGLSVETIQDVGRESVTADPQQQTAPTLRGWSHTVSPFMSAGSGTVASAAGTKNADEGAADSASPLCTQATLAQLSACRGAVTITSYNILADRLVTTDQYSTCPPAVLGEDYRIQLMKKELENASPDILTFAEMSVDVFERADSLGGFLRDTLGYCGHHVVITDQQGIPRCRPAPGQQSTPVSQPHARATAAALPLATLATAPPQPPLMMKGSSRKAAGSRSPPPTLAPLTGAPALPEIGKSTSREQLAPVAAPLQRTLSGLNSGKLSSANSDTSSMGTPQKRTGSFGQRDEVLPRRTEMEGVAVFYNASRFELLEKLPVYFNAAAARDEKLTAYERKKLQVSSHNVALVVALRDRQMPCQVYIVAAVHLIWQRVEAQLWQSRGLVQKLEELKAKYDAHWREARRVPTSSPLTPATARADSDTTVDSNRPSLRAGTSPSTVQTDGKGQPNAPLPSIDGDQHQPLPYTVCVIAGDFNADNTNPVLSYLCDGVVPADSPVIGYWRGGTSPCRTPETGDGQDSQPSTRCVSLADDDESRTTSTSGAISPGSDRRRSTQTACGVDSVNYGESPSNHLRHLVAPRRESVLEETGTTAPTSATLSQSHRQLTPTTSHHRRQRLAPLPAIQRSAEECSLERFSISAEQMKETARSVVEVGLAPMADRFDATPCPPRKTSRRLSTLLATDGVYSGRNELTGVSSPSLMPTPPPMDLTEPELCAPPAPSATRRQRSSSIASPDGARPLPTLRRRRSQSGMDSSMELGSADSAVQWARARSPHLTASTLRPKPSSARDNCASPIPVVGVASPAEDMSQSVSLSEGGSVLSTGLEVDRPMNLPRHTPLTPGNLDFALFTATGRSDTDHVEHTTGEDSDTAVCSTTSPQKGVQVRRRPPSSPDSSVTLSPRAAGNTTAPLLQQSPSTAERGSSSGPRPRAAPVRALSPAAVQPRPPASQPQQPREQPSAAPGMSNALRLTDAYEVYCRHHPGQVSAVNPSSNQEGKVLDHVLYESDHVVCTSVLRLGERVELPTNTIPSDHYMIGAVLVPRSTMPPRALSS